MTGYTRQSTYSDGDTILAADSNNEYDALEISMAAGTGHAHDNNAGQGAYVPLISNVANSRTVTITASGALTTGDHQVTGQIISDSGPITATLGDVVVTAGNITATAGSVDATAGAVSAGTTVTAGTGVTATTGGVTATAGDITATANDIIATAGNIDAVAGSLNAGTTVTAGTGATVTTGNLAVSSGNITVSGTVDGRDVATDGTKLDGIETNAKDDQTAAEVVSTPAGNLIATDVQAALNELDVEKAALAGAAFTGAITTTSTFDGRDVSIDGDKLDSIETGSTADQTAADIRALGFFDTTNDGSGSGLDADVLDNIDSTSFLRSDVNDSFEGARLTVHTADGTLGTSASIVDTLEILQDTSATDAFMTFHVQGDFAGHFGISGVTNDLFVGGFSYGAVRHKVFHEGNSAAARSWVNFNGTGTIAIRDSFNVSSVGDNGVGNYTINIATDFSNANFACLVTCGLTDQSGTACVNTKSAGQCTISTVNVNGSSAFKDYSQVDAALFGDQ